MHFCAQPHREIFVLFIWWILNKIVQSLRYEKKLEKNCCNAIWDNFQIRKFLCRHCRSMQRSVNGLIITTVAIRYRGRSTGWAHCHHRGLAREICACRNSSCGKMQNTSLGRCCCAIMNPVCRNRSEDMRGFWTANSHLTNRRVQKFSIGIRNHLVRILDYSDLVGSILIRFVLFTFCMIKI